MNNKPKFGCEECGFHTNYKSKWELHIQTEKHKTGKRKERSDKKCPKNCPNCKYTTRSNAGMRVHILTNHSTQEDRKKEFTYYCAACDYGTFCKFSHDNHLQTNKHKRMEK